MARKRDLRTSIISAVIGAVLATLVWFLYTYFLTRNPEPAAPTAAPTEQVR